MVGRCESKKSERERDNGNKEHSVFFTLHRELDTFLTFFGLDVDSLYDYSSFIHVLCFCCWYNVALRWSFFKRKSEGLGGQRATASSVMTSLGRHTQFHQNDKMDFPDFILSL